MCSSGAFILNVSHHYIYAGVYGVRKCFIQHVQLHNQKIKITLSRICSIGKNGVQERWHFGICWNNVLVQYRTLWTHESATIQQKAGAEIMKRSGIGVICGSQVWVFLCWQRFEVSDHHNMGICRREKLYDSEKPYLVIKARNGCAGIAYHAPGVQRDLDFRLSSHISRYRWVERHPLW